MHISSFWINQRVIRIQGKSCTQSTHKLRPFLASTAPISDHSGLRWTQYLLGEILHPFLTNSSPDGDYIFLGIYCAHTCPQSTHMGSVRTFLSTEYSHEFIVPIFYQFKPWWTLYLLWALLRPFIPIEHLHSIDFFWKFWNKWPFHFV